MTVKCVAGRLPATTMNLHTVGREIGSGRSDKMDNLIRWVSADKYILGLSEKHSHEQ